MPARFPHPAASFLLIVLAGLAGGAAHAGGVGPFELERGEASVYHDKYEGRRTASGVRFRQDRLTAAHRSLSFGSRVTAVNLANGRAVEVEIIDRGPFVAGRVLDLSRRAAEALGVRGVAQVAILVD